LDEPTNHLDIDSRETLVEALNDFPGAVILISHDPHLIESTVDRLWLVHDGTVKDFDGDLDEYKALVLNGTISGTTGQRDKRDVQPKVNKAEARRIAAQRRIEYAPLAKKIKEAEEIVAKLQKKIQGIEAEFANPGNSPDHVRKLGMDETDAQNRLAMAEENWLTLSDEYEMKMSA
jgi:ATP-binding cassette, subfamily F, member 3